VVPGIDGNGGGGVPGLDEGEVVGSHVGETLGVLVDEGGLGDGVGTREVAGEEEVVAVGGGGAHTGGGGGVVGPVGGDGGVLDSKEKNLDGVGETDVVAGRVGGVVGLDGGGLDLLDEDVTGGTGHALPLVVGHNGVVGPDLDVGEVHIGVQEISRGGGATSAVGGGGTTSGCGHIPSSQEIEEPTEREVEAHVVVGKSGRGEGHTRVAGIEEGEGKVEHLGGEVKSRVDQVAGGSDHVGITNLLGTGCGESRPEIELEVAEASRHQVVEGDAGLKDQVVSHIGRPRKESLDRAVVHTGPGGHRCRRGDGRESEAKPCVQEVITRTGDGHRPLLSKPGCSRGTAQHNGHLGEPCSLASLADEVGGRIGTTIHVLLKLIIRGEINKPAREI